MDVVEEIKGRIDVVQLVSQYVQLKKAGRNFKGLCPFHSEKSPSFVVSPEKQICHCFGCNKGGDIFTFIQEVEGVTFKEAIKILAEKANIAPEKLDKYKGKSVSRDEKEEYFKAHELAAKMFEEQLYNTADGKKVLDYLHRRGLTNEIIKEFKIGFAPEKFDFLHPFLLKRGISKKVLVESGFVSTKQVDASQIYDKYRSRLMFPIFDYLGRICGFAGRALKKDQMPKYLNSPENIIYNKSKVLYGLYHAKQAIKDKDGVVVVEGYFDMLLPYQIGVKNVVATSGTALTTGHVRLIKRLSKNVTTCFDNDEAGFAATKRAYDLLFSQEMNVKSVVGFGEKDPADYVRDHGEEFNQVLDEAKPFVSLYIERLVSRIDVTGIEGRQKVIRELLPILKPMSATGRDFHLQELAKALGVKRGLLQDEIDNFDLPQDHPARQHAQIEENRAAVFNKNLDLDELVCAILVEYPQLFEEASKHIDENLFDELTKSVYNDLSNQYNSSRENFEKWDFGRGFTSETKDKVKVLSLYAEERYASFSEDAIKQELEKLIAGLARRRKTRKLQEVQLQIAEAEKNQNKEELIKLLKLQQQLISN